MDVRAFQPSWTKDFGFISQWERAVCAFCCENVVCRTSSVRRHFETKHDKTIKDDVDKVEEIMKAVSRYEKQIIVFKKMNHSKIMQLRVATKSHSPLPNMEIHLLMGII